MKLKELAKVIRELIQKEVQKQVSEQVTRILQEQQMVSKYSHQKPTVNTQTKGTQKPDFGIRLDEPLMMETNSPLTSMMSNIEYDEFGGNMHFDSHNLTTVQGILDSTAQQMKHESEHGPDGFVDTSRFVKDYSQVLRASIDKSNGTY